MRTRTVSAVVAVALVASNAGCGGDQPAVPTRALPSPTATVTSVVPSATPTASPQPTSPPGNTVVLSCYDEDHVDGEVTINSGPNGLPDFTDAWARKFVSCDVSAVNSVEGDDVVLPVTDVEKGVHRASKEDGYDEDDNIAFFYEDCADVDPDDPFIEPGFKLSSEQIPDMFATLTLCPKHPHAAKWRGALKRGQGEAKLEKDGRVFGAGTYRVGKEVKPGTYVARNVDGCYWERQNRNGEIIDNNFVNAAKRVQVTIRSSDYGFHTTGCGTWRPA